MIEILLADDHSIITDGLTTLLNDVGDICVAATCSNGQEVLNFLSVRSVDIVILDIDMPVMDGRQAAKTIVAEHSSQKFAMLTMHHEASLIKNFLDLGASGYFLKTIDKDEFILTIRQMHTGKKYFPADVVTSLSQSSQKKDLKSTHDLSDRELEIIELLCDGLTNKQIGEKVFISPRTVDTHRTNIMRKLDVNNVAGIIRFAYKTGLVEP